MVVDKHSRLDSPSPRANVRTVALDQTDEIRRLRLELAAQTQRVETLTKLAGTVAHDFNNVLMAISAGVTLAGRGITDERAADRLHDIRDAIRTGASLASQMTCLLRSHHVSTVQIVHVDSVVRQMRCLFAALAGKRIELRLDLQAELANLEIHPAYLQQILLNLVLNARDAIRDEGVIAISTRLCDGPDPRICIRVADNGEGIAPERKDEVFRQFHTSKQDRGGTGLGLFIVSTLVEELKGEIVLDSELGKGTIFAITLPCDPFTCGLEEDSTPTDVLRDMSPGTPRSILLVEDHRQVHRAVRTLLEDDGHVVWSAGSVLEAEKLIDQRAAELDVVLTESILPDATGCHLAKFARVRRPNIRVVFMSGQPYEDLIARDRVDPGAPFLQKPFSGEELLRRVIRDEA